MEGMAEIKYYYKIQKKTNFPKIKKIKYKNKIFNLILFEIILIFLSKIKRCKGEEHYIEIKVNENGKIQILSDEYRGTLPSKVYINGNISSMNDKKVIIESKDNIISLKWTNTISSFSYMFSNISIITSVHMNYMFGQNNSFDYMFHNCYNLENFAYNINYDKSHSIKNLTGMFYNCTSLLTFNFNKLYIDYFTVLTISSFDPQTNKTNYNYEYHYHYISMAYMFYNCHNLKSVNDGNNKYKYINNMRGMFYNCFSLTSLNLEGFKTDLKFTIDLSYMLYNCSKLEIFKKFNDELSVRDIKYYVL